MNIRVDFLNDASLLTVCLFILQPGVWYHKTTDLEKAYIYRVCKMNEYLNQYLRLGGLFMTPGSMLFSGLNAISLYGGLVLFGGFLLYDTQKIIYHAESAQKYDPVNA